MVMITEELISQGLPVLAPNSTGSQALELLAQTKLRHLPLVKDSHYLGLVDEEGLGNALKNDLRLEQLDTEWDRPFISSISHPFEAFRMVYEQDLMVLPVLDGDQRYLGAITLRDLLRYATENSGWDVPGGIVVFMVSTVEYSLQRIAMICEEESLTVMGVQLRPHVRGGWVEVTLKLHRNDLDGLIQALERHGYRLMEVYGDLPRREEVMDRYQMLMNYINM